uniref:Uncharacterized protein n=1 Tax=Meloidogyne incognita TaxID=6306 RepID=A0A914LBP9_MELIC
MPSHSQQDLEEICSFPRAIAFEHYRASQFEPDRPPSFLAKFFPIYLQNGQAFLSSIPISLVYILPKNNQKEFLYPLRWKLKEEL